METIKAKYIRERFYAIPITFRIVGCAVHFRRTGSRGVWVCRHDGEKARKLGYPPEAVRYARCL